MYFEYGDTELEYLKKADKRLAEVIEFVGDIKRVVIPDLFAALVNSIIGQQISTKAHQTIWKRIVDELVEVTPEAIDRLSLEKLHKFGISFRKASYIKSAASKVLCGELEIGQLHSLSDKEVCSRLCELEGIGVWTAEMLMLFSMQRQDVLSYGDLAIRRGLQILYRHKTIDKAKFERYRKRFSPYGSVASLYLWAVAGGGIEGMRSSSNETGTPKSRSGFNTLK